jgi:phosphotransferase system HPr (HPr) family protein
MAEPSLEKLVPEQDFLRPLALRAQPFARLANTLVGPESGSWTKRHYFQLYSEADDLESFLDDYGARYNKTYHYLTELTASVRGFSLAGLSLEHLHQRLEGYCVLVDLGDADQEQATKDIEHAHRFVHTSLVVLLQDFRKAVKTFNLGLAPDEVLPRETLEGAAQHFRLPRNLGQEEIKDEEQKIAEVASKYLQACKMLEEAGIRRIQGAEARERFIHDHCTEELSRVYEATVHNLQSAYDTYIKNTVLEASDERLARLRGHISTTLHLLEAVTQLTHFVERHESGIRTDSAERKLGDLVQPSLVRDVTLNRLLVWADAFMQTGRELAAELLPTYTTMQRLEVELSDDLILHARPASLIVSIVNHYGTPVEMELAGEVCNAGSILELMILVGSNPDARKYVFKGDQYPLRDLGLLFESSLGESGVDALPELLSYLKS